MNVYCCWKHTLCAAGQSCTSQVNLDSINTSELQCQRRQDCTGLDCFNQNSFLRQFANLFEIRTLPCATPSPALWLLVLGEEDLANNNRRNVVLNVTWNSTTTETLDVMSDGLSFGIYQFSVNFSRSEAGSSVEFAVSLNTDYLWFKPFLSSSVRQHGKPHLHVQPLACMC